MKNILNIRLCMGDNERDKFITVKFHNFLDDMIENHKITRGEFIDQLLIFCDLVFNEKSPHTCQKEKGLEIDSFCGLIKKLAAKVEE